MRHARIDLDRIGLVIAIETVAEAPDISERNDVVGLAEYTEHRALDASDNVFQRLWEALADFHSLSDAAPYHTSAAAIGLSAANTSGCRPVWHTPLTQSWSDRLAGAWRAPRALC